MRLSKAKRKVRRNGVAYIDMNGKELDDIPRKGWAFIRCEEAEHGIAKIRIGTPRPEENCEVWVET